MLTDPGVRSVLVVRLRVGLGDLLVSAPALRALRRARPDVHIAVVTWPEMHEVLERQSAYVDELVPFPGWPGIPERPPRTDLIAPFLNRVKARRFDVALQMYGGQPEANEVTSLMGARRSGGFFTPGLWDADVRSHMPYPHDLHEVERHLMLMRFLGIPADDAGMEFTMHARDIDAARAILRLHGVNGDGYVCVHPGATAPSRRWRPERFAAVADALARDGWRVVLTGNAGERTLTAAVTAAMAAPCVDLAGATSLGAFAALLAGSGGLISNDSGPAHVAAALRVPSVTVFMAGDPARWAAPDRTLHRPVYADVVCRPCGHQVCPIDLRCATELDPASVVTQAREVMAPARQRASA